MNNSFFCFNNLGKQVCYSFKQSLECSLSVSYTVFFSCDVGLMAFNNNRVYDNAKIVRLILGQELVKPQIKEVCLFSNDYQNKMQQSSLLLREL